MTIERRSQCHSVFHLLCLRSGDDVTIDSAVSIKIPRFRFLFISMYGVSPSATCVEYDSRHKYILSISMYGVSPSATCVEYDSRHKYILSKCICTRFSINIQRISMLRNIYYAKENRWINCIIPIYFIHNILRLQHFELPYNVFFGLY